jgi:hypothetical protein
MTSSEAHCTYCCDAHWMHSHCSVLAQALNWLTTDVSAQACMRTCAWCRGPVKISGRIGALRLKALSSEPKKLEFRLVCGPSVGPPAGPLGGRYMFMLLVLIYLSPSHI